MPYNGFSEELTIKVSPNCLENQPSTKWEFKVLYEKSIPESALKIKSREFIGVMTEHVKVQQWISWEIAKCFWYNQLQ